MSSSYRGRQTFGKPETLTYRPPTAKQIIARKTMQAIRAIKRQLIDDGTIMDPANRPPQYRYAWSWGDLSGDVLADDTSAARSQIKRDLGLPKKKRLPKAITIIREVNLDYYNGAAQSLENLQTSNGPGQRSLDVGAGNSVDLGSDGG